MSRDAHTLEELALVPVGRDLGPGDEMGTLGDLVVLVVDDRIATLDAATGEDVTCALSDVAPVEVRTIGLSPTLSDMSPDSYGRLILNEDHTRLLTAGEDGAICLWDESGELLWELEAGTGTFGAAEFLMFLPSGDVFVQGSISAAGMGQHLLVDGETGSVVASSDDAPLISDAWPSQDGTSLFASSRSYAFVTLDSSFVDGIFTIDLSPESFGVDSQMPYAVAVSQDEERALFYNQMAEELFTLPTYTTDELVASYKSQPIIPFEERIALMKAIKGPDIVIPQKSLDHTDKVKKLKFDIFVVGDDWVGKYDYLEKLGVSVVYFPYGDGVSSSSLKRRIWANFESIKAKTDNHFPADIEFGKKEKKR